MQEWGQMSILPQRSSSVCQRDETELMKQVDEKPHFAAQAPKVGPEAEAETVKPDKPICHAFARSGQCKNGPRCRFSHTVRALSINELNRY